MRKVTITLVALGLLSICLAAPVLAANLLSEPFTYPNGNLVPNGGWATHSGAGADIQVSTGTAVGYMLNAPDDNKTFAAQLSTAKTYACFNVTIPTPAAAAADTNYFAHFKDTGTTNFQARVWMLPASPTQFRFGLSSGSCACNTNCVPVPWGTLLNYGQQYVVAISYNGTGGVSELWVDPVNELSTKITSTANAGIAVSAFALRQSNSPPSACPGGSYDWKFIVDNLGVGTTFNDACAFGPTSSQHNTWGQVKAIYR